MKQSQFCRPFATPMRKTFTFSENFRDNYGVCRLALALPEPCCTVHTLVPLESETEDPDASAYIATAAREIPALSHLIPPHRESSRLRCSCVFLWPKVCNTLVLHNPLLVLMQEKYSVLFECVFDQIFLV